MLLIFKKYLFLLAESGVSCDMQSFSCSMWDRVPWAGIERGTPALGVHSMSHWNTRKSPQCWNFLKSSQRVVSRIEHTSKGFSFKRQSQKKKKKKKKPPKIKIKDKATVAKSWYPGLGILKFSLYYFLCCICLKSCKIKNFKTQLPYTQNFNENILKCTDNLTWVHTDSLFSM